MEVHTLYEDIQVSQSCTISEEFVHLIANAFPEKLMKYGVVDPERTLHFLGFRTSGLYDIEYTRDVLIRDNKFPSRVYRGNIYNGRLRNNLSKQGESGYALYNWLFDKFAEFNVLQPANISGKEFQCILEIGSLRDYNGT